MDRLQRWITTELWDHVPVAISVIDPEFRIVDANRTFTDTYGPWKDAHCYAVYKGIDRPCERCPAVETFRDGCTRANEEEGRPRDGKPTHYLVQMVPLVDRHGVVHHVIEMSTDISAMKTLEKEKLDAERLAAVGNTVAGLAHGVKNVLMGLDGAMYIMRTGLERGDAGRILEGWPMLEESIARITTFVKDFLEFARGRTPAVQLTDPNLVARRVIDLFTDAAEAVGITIRSDLQEDMPYALLDEEAIHASLANLVSNSIDACQISDRPGGTVTIRTRDADGILRFEVADDGAGMDYEVKKHIFTNFFTTKGSDKGTGLGLLTTRKIVQEHGGRVSFESTEQVGSVFRLLFPHDRLPQRASQTTPDAPSRNHAGPKERKANG